MNSIQEAHDLFLRRADYRALARAIYEASKTYYPDHYKEDFDSHYVGSGKIPYCWEIQYVLNHPEATLDSLWREYHLHYQQGFTEEIYKMDPIGWDILIGLSNALRHTIQPHY